PWRERVAGGVGPAHLCGDLAGELQYLPVEEEESGELQLGDQVELLAQACLREPAQSGRAVAILESSEADLAQLPVGRVEAVREVGVAVPELLGQVEREAAGDLGRAQDRVPVVGGAVDHLLGCKQDRLVVAPPLLL